MMTRCLFTGLKKSLLFHMELINVTISYYGFLWSASK